MPKATLLILGLTLTIVFKTTVSAQTEIAVGVYDYPPIASVNSKNQAEGLLGDLLRELDSNCVRARRDLSRRARLASARKVPLCESMTTATCFLWWAHPAGRRRLDQLVVA